MAMRDRQTRPNQRTLLLAVLTVVAAGYGVAGMARQAAEFGPSVGDIIVFDPARAVGFESEARLTVGRSNGGNCVLDLGTVRRSGGSLVLEQRGAAPDRLYRGHWAGGRTSDDRQTDCGTATDLVLTPSDMGALAASAGGIGPDSTTSLRLR
jgi:hypothetical protein